MNDGLLARLSLQILPKAVGMLSQLLFATCRLTVHGEEHRQDTVDRNRQVIGTFWHYSLLGCFMVLRKYKGVAMVSSSKDGEYIARLVESFGFSTVRGSRNKQGVQALKDLLREAKTGKHVAIVADGSQGPPRVAQAGSILLASRTGAPILPVAWGASSYLAIRSWDRTAFPKPFSRVDFIFGEPLEVPPGLKSDGIETYRQLLEDRLNSLYEQVWAMHGKTEH